MDDSLQLGPFDITEQIGEGGMGAVYRGRHRITGVDVAIKVIRNDIATDRLREQFHVEVQAQAKLVHPNIVYLFEYGRISPETATISDGEFSAGNHFVAMEYAARGTLQDDVTVDNWPQLRAVIVQVLDALAFAHARGVVHRDLKPENLLLFEEDRHSETDLRIKLADFGLAHAVELAADRDTEMLESVSGTPHYMAPEQAYANWRNYGPWTDIYALGCIVWELCCGRPPFDAPTAAALLLKHLRQSRPELELQFPVPDELQLWIHRAMAIETDQRFRCAAHALRALPAADGFDHQVTSQPVEHIGTLDTLPQAPDLSEPSPANRETELLEHLPTAEGSDTPVGTTLSSDDICADTLEHITALRHDDGPVPRDWKLHRTDDLPLPLIGTGLELFELREVPFVDRDPQRDLIWQMLQQADRTDMPHLVALVGEAGAGKSRLAEWMTIRAHELGAAELFRAFHTPEGQGRREGLAGMVRWKFRSWKLDRAEFYEVLLDRLPALTDQDRSRNSDAKALTELAFPTDDNEETAGPNYRYSSSRQKFAVLARLMKRFARRRPVILWLDDVQWNTEALRLARFLLQEASESIPLLVLTTLRSDVLAEKPDTGEQVDELLHHDRAERIEIAPLSRRHHRELLDRMLPLDTRLAERVIDRTEGNPLFATQLLGDWIERNRLVVGDNGFHLADDADFQLPEDVHQLWMNRIDRVVDDTERISKRSGRWAIERAAALGREVNQREWEAAWSFEERDILIELRELLIERGLARRTGDGFAFTHGLLVDSIAHRARQQGTWADHHLRCAQMLGQLYPENPWSTARRRAGHLINAGCLNEALQPLLKAGIHARLQDDFHAHRQLLSRRAQLLDQLSISEYDPRRVEQQLEWTRLQWFRGDIEQATTNCTRLWDHTDDDQWTLRTKIASLLIRLKEDHGNYETALRWADRALEASGHVDDRTLRTKVHIQTAWLRYFRGELDKAEFHLRHAEQLSDLISDSYLFIQARRLKAQIMLNRNPPRALTLLQEVYRRAKHAGFVDEEAFALNDLGEWLRNTGRPDRAREYYRRYLVKARSLSRPLATASALLNIAQIDIEVGQFQQALRRLDECDEILEAIGSEQLYGNLRLLVRLAVAAGTGNSDRFDELWGRLPRDWSDHGVFNDHPMVLETTAGYASDNNWSPQAEELLQLARRLWQRIGDDEAVERVDERLTEIR